MMSFLDGLLLFLEFDKTEPEENDKEKTKNDKSNQ